MPRSLCASESTVEYLVRYTRPVKPNELDFPTCHEQKHSNCSLQKAHHKRALSMEPCTSSDYVIVEDYKRLHVAGVCLDFFLNTSPTCVPNDSVREMLAAVL